MYACMYARMYVFNTQLLRIANEVIVLEHSHLQKSVTTSTLICITQFIGTFVTRIHVCLHYKRNRCTSIALARPLTVSRHAEMKEGKSG